VKSLRLWWTEAFNPVHCRVAHGVRVMAICWVDGVRPPQPMLEANAAPTPWSRGRVLSQMAVPAQMSATCRHMSSNVVSFRHSSRHAMSPSRRHDRRHVADMSPTRHAMSANEGLGRHFRLRHSLLSQLNCFGILRNTQIEGIVSWFVVHSSNFDELMSLPLLYLYSHLD